MEESTIKLIMLVTSIGFCVRVAGKLLSAVVQAIGKLISPLRRSNGTHGVPKTRLIAAS